MGIPGLARRLEPYGSRCSCEELKGYTAVIDGPSLAYHAHRLASSNYESQSRLPTYVDINNDAIRWLTSLEDYVKVLHILFDGVLPIEKRPERLMRTEQNNRRVQQLRASYATNTCPVPTYLGSTAYSFLAPSLREALARSAFDSRTHVVPGEADDFCALRAKENSKVIIFTSDTDLLLFEYQPDTLIILFQDTDSSQSFKAYSPHQIATKLKLKSLIPFAWSVHQRTSESQEDLVHDARSLDMESSAYLAFSGRYTLVNTFPSYTTEQIGLSLALQVADVRVSEFIHPALMGSNPVPLYLPLLVEDPNQASAWRMGQDIRTLAYSLLAKPASTVSEYRRKAQSITAHEISTMTNTQILPHAKEVGEKLGGLMKWAESRNTRPTLLWSMFALSLILVEMNTPPPIALLLRVLNGEFDNTWAFIQLSARLQAAMYSVRILKQIIAIRLALGHDIISELHDILLAIQGYLSTFSCIADTFIVPGQAHRVLEKHKIIEGYIEEIYESVGMQVPVEQISNKKKRKQAREADRKKRKAEQRQQPSEPVSNMFEVLHTGR